MFYNGDCPAARCSPVNDDLIRQPQIREAVVLAQCVSSGELLNLIVVLLHVLKNLFRFSCQAQICSILLFRCLQAFNRRQAVVFVVFYNSNGLVCLQSVASLALPFIWVNLLLLTGVTAISVAKVGANIDIRFGTAII